jgi:hypothetical protein
MDAIKRDFGSFENMKSTLSTMSTGVQVSDLALFCERVLS